MNAENTPREVELNELGIACLISAYRSLVDGERKSRQEFDAAREKLNKMSKDLRDIQEQLGQQARFKGRQIVYVDPKDDIAFIIDLPRDPISNYTNITAVPATVVK